MYYCVILFQLDIMKEKYIYYSVYLKMTQTNVSSVALRVKGVEAGSSVTRNSVDVFVSSVVISGVEGGSFVVATGKQYSKSNF